MADNRPALRRYFKALGGRRLGRLGDFRPISRDREPGGKLGMAAGAPDFRHFHIGPRVAVSHQRGKHRVIELVAAAQRAISADQWSARQRQIADRIHNFVADEFVRHKAVDAIGDLALSGAPLIGAYRSVRGGHKLNHAVLTALMADCSAWSYVEMPESRRPRGHADLPAGFARPAYGPDVS